MTCWLWQGHIVVSLRRELFGLDLLLSNDGCVASDLLVIWRLPCYALKEGRLGGWGRAFIDGFAGVSGEGISKVSQR